MTIAKVKLWVRVFIFMVRNGMPLRGGPIPQDVIGEPVDDRTETAAQALHAFRHLAGTASVCGECRTHARIAISAYNRNR